ncbi:uncharacterized protein LOC131213711 [Anopheles bellator]|uniref:uncharacterized protein LOC131213711 n=1 Tax=Anopheles bellator TaxID=139047 RepID=UPI0026475E20|nr:uncharacterized protein LOC131213711 [Anopheles bellator]
MLRPMCACVSSDLLRPDSEMDGWKMNNNLSTFTKQPTRTKAQFVQRQYANRIQSRRIVNGTRVQRMAARMFAGPVPSGRTTKIKKDNTRRTDKVIAPRSLQNCYVEQNNRNGSDQNGHNRTKKPQKGGIIAGSSSSSNDEVKNITDTLQSSRDSRLRVQARINYAETKRKNPSKNQRATNQKIIKDQTKAQKKESLTIREEQADPVGVNQNSECDSPIRGVSAKALVPSNLQLTVQEEQGSKLVIMGKRTLLDGTVEYLSRKRLYF